MMLVTDSSTAWISAWSASGFCPRPAAFSRTNRRTTSRYRRSAEIRRKASADMAQTRPARWFTAPGSRWGKLLEGSDGVPKIAVDLQEHVESGRRQRLEGVTSWAEQLQIG